MMNITDGQIGLICYYYKEVIGVGRNEKSISEMSDMVAGKMYTDLFKKHPGYERFFPSDIGRMNDLKCKVYEVLRFAIAQLYAYQKKEINKVKAISEITDVFTRLGKFHRNIIDEHDQVIQDGHFNAVGGSLIFALKEAGGSVWSAAMEKAWVALYTDLYLIMKEAMSGDGK